MEDEDFADEGPVSWTGLPFFEYDESDTSEFGEECLEFLSSLGSNGDLRETVFHVPPILKTAVSPEAYDLELGVLLARTRTLSCMETQRVQYLMRERLLTLTTETPPDSKYGLLWYKNAKLTKRKTAVEKVSKWKENWKNKRRKNADWTLKYFEIIDGILRAYDTKVETESLWEAKLSQYTIETGISTKGKKDCFILRRQTSSVLNEAPLEVCLGCGHMKELIGWIKMFQQICKPSSATPTDELGVSLSLSLSLIYTSITHSLILLFSRGRRCF